MQGLGLGRRPGPIVEETALIVYQQSSSIGPILAWSGWLAVFTRIGAETRLFFVATQTLVHKEQPCRSHIHPWRACMCAALVGADCCFAFHGAQAQLNLCFFSARLGLGLGLCLGLGWLCFAVLHLNCGRECSSVRLGLGSERLLWVRTGTHEAPKGVPASHTTVVVVIGERSCSRSWLCFLCKSAKRPGRRRVAIGRRCKRSSAFRDVYELFRLNCFACKSHAHTHKQAHTPHTHTHTAITQTQTGARREQINTHNATGCVGLDWCLLFLAEREGVALRPKPEAAEAWPVL